MRELTLHSLHADGEHLVLVDESGQQFRIAIDDALRSAVRSDRPYLEAIRAGTRSALPPREIQARLRAGASVADVAAESGLPRVAIERYESPVLAERAWMVEQTQKLAIGHEVGAPTLGDLVVDRLAARGETAPVRWDARRAPGAPWEVSVTFGSDGEHVATWQVDLQARSLTALNSESRLLSETDLQDRRGHTPFDVEADAARRGADLLIRDSRVGAAPADAPASADHATDSLLERLGRARGRRDPAVPQPEAERAAQDDDDALAAESLFPVAPVVPLRRGEPAEPTELASAPAAAAEEPEPAPAPDKAKRSRSRRASVPAWDEIIFGSRGE